VAGPVTNNAVAVTNGLFTVLIDFGPGVFNGATNWLEIGVETNGGGSFTTLAPRQQLTPAPYAIFAEGANAAGLSGTIPMASLSGTYGGAVNLTNAGNSVSGNGAGLTGVNAAALNGLNATNFWQIGGNAGTSPTNGNFLGTADVQPIELRVGGLRGWRLEPDPRGAQAANIIGGYISNAVEQSGSGADFIGSGGYVGGVNTIHSNTSGAFIGAGSANQIGPNLFDAVIAGGYGNTIGPDGSRSVIGGGFGNTNNEYDSVIGGGQNNFVQQYADHAFIGGGQNNSIGGSFSLPIYGTIGGGLGNVIQSNVSYSFIGGGNNNTIQTNASYGFIGGGQQNTIQNGATYATVPGGYGNKSTAEGATVAGGGQNTSSAQNATVSGGENNTSSGYDSTVPGGGENQAAGNWSFAAGVGARATHTGAFVWADASDFLGFGSTTSNQFSVRALGGVRLVTGGAGVSVDGATITPQPTATDANHSNIVNVVEGSSANFVSAGVYGATISGGGAANYNSSAGTNSVLADFGTVGGGIWNTVSGQESTIAGGFRNSANFDVGGTIGGGWLNYLSGFSMQTVGGGYENVCSNSFATVPGGYQNTAAGQYSFAAGRRAKANHDGAFVWADSLNADFASTGTNQFLIRASGGVGINTNNPAGAALNVVGVVRASSFQGDGSGLTNVTGLPLGNYVFVYATSAQIVSSPATFQDVFFNNTAALQGWTVNGAGDIYFCAQTGLYLVQYTAEATTSAGGPVLFSLRANLNGSEIPGSEANGTVDTSSSAVAISKSFLVSVNSGNSLSLQFAANNIPSQLQGGGIAGIQPSASLTITRIQ
jgi:BclA-like protein